LLTGFNPPLNISEVESLFPNLEFLEVIKPGNEGAVFKCYDKSCYKDVILKIYGSNRSMRRTELEISKMQIATSPYLARLVSSGINTVRSLESYYLTTEFVNGYNLGDRLKNGEKLTNDEVTRLILNISHAIQALWDAKVVHSDIKPENIMCSNNGGFILIDLGVAKHLDAEPLTAVNVLCYGTEGYLAPEQYTGRKNLTLRADFYSLGITAWQSITGSHPFAYNQALMKQSVPPLPKGIEASSELLSAITKLANPIAYRRPANWGEISKMLVVGER